MNAILILSSVTLLISLGGMYVGFRVSNRVWNLDVHREPIWFKKMMERITVTFLLSVICLLAGGFLTWLELSKWHW